MFIDIDLRLSSSQALTAIGTVQSQYVVDLGACRDIGEGTPLYVYFSINNAFVSAGAATLTTSVIGSDTLTSEQVLASPVVLGSSGLVTLARLTADRRFALTISPQIGDIGYRYLACQYTVATAAFTAGTITADIVETIAGGACYPAGTTMI